MPPKFLLLKPSQEDAIRHLLNAQSYLSQFYSDYYAVTLTLKASEKKILRERGCDCFDYLAFKLKSLGYSGVVIGEYTKKKVEHVHGILKISKDILKPVLSKDGNFKFYIDERLDASNVIKVFKDNYNYQKWCEYMQKCLPSLEVIDWMEKYGTNGAEVCSEITAQWW